VASILAGLRRWDEAFESLDQAFEQRAVRLLYLPFDPRFASVKGDERYRLLLGGIGLSGR